MPQSSNKKTLVIVESPAKASTIKKYLGNDYVVKASVGHVRDLPKSNKKAIDIKAGFKPHYEISKGKEEVVEELKERAKNAKQVLLATDPDREGEAIAWHVMEAADLDPKKTKRVVFHEITKDAVQDAIEHPREIDENLKTAQEARRVLDRLVGYDLSGLIWKKVRYGLSAGRVQSPALRILMEREREIRAFKPVTYWVITAHLQRGSAFEAVCSEEPTEKAEMERILSAGKGGAWYVKDITESDVKRSPKAPFITSTLQQTASSRLGFAPSRTMRIAQQLYEAGHITYMRTDSTNISEVAHKQMAKLIPEAYGEKYYERRNFKTKSSSAQEAHEAVRPTNMMKEKAGASVDQKKLYDLIRRRTIASQMADALVKRTKLLTSIKDGGIPDFATNGSRLLFDGWFKADPMARGDDVEVPKLEKGADLDCSDVTSEEKETQPPSRYTEAGLVKELEKRGIGRPSTYASIIKTIQDRGYVEKENKALRPTVTGEVVSTFLEDHFTKWISDDFTAEMENELDEIAEGKRKYVPTLKSYYEPLTKDIEAKQDIEKLTNLGPTPKEYQCPKCGSGMVYKLGKSGTFMSCDRYPDCDGARTEAGEEMQGPKDTGELCPECGKGNLVERDGKYGRFTACERYPKCKYVKKDPEAEAARSTGVKCPECQAGEMTEKRGRYGVFYACTNYPKCKYAIKAKPTGKKCNECGSLMMEGTKTIPERCSSKQCPNHNPHKANN